MVGRALAGRLGGLGHDVVIGTRDVERTLERADAGMFDTPPYREWQKANPEVRLLEFADAGAHAELVLNATSGEISLAALQSVGAANLAGKVLIDLALPLDFSEGMPPKLTVVNSDSLGEQIQRAFPDARVVKTLNTVFFDVMIDPARVPGKHNIFLAGEDDEAKDSARGFLEQFGWPRERMIDLGGIKSARATEMYMQLYFQLAHVLDTFDFNISVVQSA
jgi:predicted dinucleotide-binding enzyme